MDNGDSAEKRGRSAAMIALTDEDLIRLAGIEVDRDAQEALAFVRERILPEVQRQQNSRMKGALEGRTGSMK